MRKTTVLWSYAPPLPPERGFVPAHDAFTESRALIDVTWEIKAGNLICIYNDRYSLLIPIERLISIEDATE